MAAALLYDRLVYELVVHKEATQTEEAESIFLKELAVRL